MKKITLMFFMSLLSLTAFAQFPEGFEGTWPPTGWEIHDNGVGPAASWQQSQLGNPAQPPHTGDYAAYLNKENVATGMPEDWLVTPAFTVPTNAQLQFWSRLVQGGDQGSIYRIYITTNTTDPWAAANYTQIQQWTELEINPIQDAYVKKIVNIPAVYEGQSVKLAFVMIADNGDRWLVDDVTVLSQCLDPTNLGANSFGLTTANLTWTNNSGPGATWEIEVIGATEIPTGTGTPYPGASPYPATGLTQDTDYKFYVRAVCSDGGTSAWVGPFYFSTVALGATCNAPIEITTLPYSNSNNTSNFGDDYSGGPGASGCGSTSAYLNGDDVVYSYTAPANGTISINLSGFGTSTGMFVYTSCANIGVNCAGGVVSGGSTAPMGIPNFTVTAGQTYYIVISTWAAPQSTAYNLVVQQVNCAPPASLTATNIGMNSAQLGWSNPSGASSWEVVVQAPGTGVPSGAGTTVTTNTGYMATGLTAATQYEYYVRADCGNGTFSAWAGPFLFNTNVCAVADQCNYTFIMTDSFGDGWNGNTMTVAQNGITVATIGSTFTGGAGPISVTVPMCNNLPFTLFWNAGGAFAGEVGVSIQNGFGQTIFTKPSGTGSQNTLLYSGTVDCFNPACLPPGGLTATAITQTTASLGWAGPATGNWEYIVLPAADPAPTMATPGIATTTNPTPVTGLTASTAYKFYVRVVCSGGTVSNWSPAFNFQTQCGAFDVPFFEGFNSTSTTEFCWTVLNLNGDGDAWNMNYATNPFEGNQSAVILTDFNAGNNNDWLISPAINLTGNQRLKFHQRVQSANEPNDFEVRVSTTTADPAAFTNVLMPLASYSNTTYQEHIKNLVDGTNTPITGTVYIAWHVPSGGLDGWRLYIDNVIVEDIPTCPKPTALTAGNFTPTTADLSWTAGFNETSWEVVVQAPGTGVPTAAGTPVTGTPTYTATGLTANTQYEYYVRATCAVDDASIWTGPFLFTTACDAFTVPFYEGFNSASTSQPCWTVLNLNGDTDAWNMDYTPNPFEGNQSAAITTDFNGGNNNDWLISPQIILTGNQRLKFHQRVQSVNEPDQFEVLLSTTGTNPADFTTTIVPLATYSNTTYQEYIINLYDGATPISGPVYIAWHIPSGGPDGWRLYVDNVIVEDIPSCPDPTNLAVLGTTDTTADLTWTAGLNETQWEVIAQPQGTGEPADTAVGVIANSNTFTLTDLTPGVQYEVYIRAVCAVDDLSNWVGPVNFNTDICAPADQCIYDFIMTDSFGDSWNGNTMSVIQNGITVATLTGPTNADDQNPVTVSVGLCSGIPFELFWNAGGTFANEVGVSIYNVAYSEEVYNKPFGAGSQNTLLYSGIAQCEPITCPQPTDLLSEGYNLDAVQLMWTPGGTETQWEVVTQLQSDPYPGDTPANSVIVDEPEYLAEGLNASVFYEYYVRAVCGPDDVSFWSGPYFFNIFTPPGCAAVDVFDPELEIIAPDSEITVCPGNDNCFDFSANYYELKETDTYQVESIAYQPPYPFLGGTELNITIDDRWSPAVNLPFEFCFFGETYDEARVGSNGVVQFGENLPTDPNQFCPYNLLQSAGNYYTVPSTNFPITNAIYGVYQDINPAVSGSNVSINYQVLGNYPCRALVVNYYDVPQFNCGLDVGTQTSQIVIYEISNIIEVYVETRTPCNSWREGAGVIGIQNEAGTVGITPPGRNTGNWTATNEAWRFTPDGDNLSVVFEWLQDGAFLTNDEDISVCPTQETLLTARATYTTCTGEEIIKENNFTINIAEPIEFNEPVDLSQCSNGEAVTFDLMEAVAGMFDDLTGYNFTFYTTEEAAELGLEDNIDPSVTTDTAQTIWVRITEGDSPCFVTASFDLILNNVPPQFTASDDITVCEGTEVTLEVFAGNFDPNDPGVSYSWTLDGADLGLTTQTITVTAAGTYEVTVNNSGCVGSEEIVVSTIPVPVADAPTDVTACDSYTLPALTSGNYFDGPAGTGNAYAADDVITTTTTLYVYAESGTVPNCTNENSFTVTINDSPVVTTPGDQSVCDSYELPALAVGNYFDAPGGTGTAYTAGDMITATTVLYVYAETGTTPNCTAEESFTVTVTPSPVAQVMADVTACDMYALPALDAGNTYYDAPGGTGNMLAEGFEVTSTMTVYIYAETGTTPNCTGESSFTVTINATPVVTTPGDQQVCDSYELPSLAVGNYYEGPGGTGVMHNAGEMITSTLTLYVYAETATTPNCSAEDSFTVTVIPSPVAQVMNDVTECDSYTLPTLDAGNNYYTGSGGTGDMLAAGDVITSTQMIYIYAQTGTTPNCTAESSFTVTINATPSFGFDGPYISCLAENSTISIVNTNFDVNAATYSWTLDGAPLTASSSTLTPANGAFGTYEVTVNVNGCSTTQSVQVLQDTTNVGVMYDEGCEGIAYMVSALPVDDTEGNPSFNPDNASFAWSGPNGFTATTQEVNVTDIGMYTVQVTTDEGCVGVLEVNVISTSCAIPRGISPGGTEGSNDTFDLSSLGVNKISIFNRYGKEVYSFSGAYTDQWHGQTNSGDELPTGTYFYSIHRTGGESKTGWVYINRQN